MLRLGSFALFQVLGAGGRRDSLTNEQERIDQKWEVLVAVAGSMDLYWYSLSQEHWHTKRYLVFGTLQALGNAWHPMMHR